MQRIWEPTFSESSYGFREGRSAHQAIEAAQRHLHEGYGWTVDIDLEKFFDRVHHDRLMARIGTRISDRRMLAMIRAFLTAGVLEGGLVSPSNEGTPQGGPLSPLLSNIVLDELDKELEKRGHKFARYADDCNVYVRSRRAGQRVMETLRRFITKHLRLRINEQKSAVARPHERKFLGFTFTSEVRPRRRIAPKSVLRFKNRIREITSRTRGRKLDDVVQELNLYLTGWRGYFGFIETPTILRELDGWIRRRLRAYIWKQWKTFKNRRRELRRRGVKRDQAAALASSRKGSWRISTTKTLSGALPNGFFDLRGLVRLSPAT
jgi:RNA-directed DNA polymerase